MLPVRFGTATFPVYCVVSSQFAHYCLIGMDIFKRLGIFPDYSAECVNITFLSEVLSMIQNRKASLLDAMAMSPGLTLLKAAVNLPSWSYIFVYVTLPNLGQRENRGNSDFTMKGCRFVVRWDPAITLSGSMESWCHTARRNWTSLKPASSFPTCPDELGNSRKSRQWLR